MKQNITSMVARWFIAMQELHFTVVFVPGTSNVLADALSRPCPNLTEIALPLRTEELEVIPILLFVMAEQFLSDWDKASTVRLLKHSKYRVRIPQ